MLNRTTPASAPASSPAGSPPNTEPPPAAPPTLSPTPVALPTILRDAVRVASHAPSTHNLQPWRFRIRPDFVDLFADRTRMLPVLDPQGREVIISCGVALFYLRLALRQAGVGERVELHPEPANPDWLARVWVAEAPRAGGTPPAAAEGTAESATAPDFSDGRLFAAVPRRRTNRLRFYARSVPEALMSEMHAAAEAVEGCHLLFVPPASRPTLTALIAEGARQLGESPAFREEVARWATRASEAFDPETGVTNFPTDVGRHLTYTGGMPSSQSAASLLAAHETRMAQEAACLYLLATDRDDTPAWLQAGQALAHILLLAASQGIMAAYLDPPIQVDTLRPQVASLLGTPAHPQILLAMGFAPYGQRTPRRALETMLVR